MENTGQPNRMNTFEVRSILELELPCPTWVQGEDHPSGMITAVIPESDSHVVVRVEGERMNFAVRMERSTNCVVALHQDLGEAVLGCIPNELFNPFGQSSMTMDLGDGLLTGMYL